MKFRYIFVGLLMVFVMSMAMEAAGGEVTIRIGNIEATITFDDQSKIITKVETPSAIVKPKAISQVNMQAAETSFTTIVGASDPCIVQGGQAYCW